MPGKGNPFLKARIPRQYLLALKLEARKAGITVSELARAILKEHCERVWDTQTSGVGHLERLTRIAKQYMATLQLSRQTAELPMKSEGGAGLSGAPRRDKPEELVWTAIRGVGAYSKTEDAAKNALTRLQALEVANCLMRTELAILKDQGDAFVDDLLKELRQSTDELEKKIEKGTGDRAD